MLDLVSGSGDRSGSWDAEDPVGETAIVCLFEDVGGSWSSLSVPEPVLLEEAGTGGINAVQFELPRLFR